MFPSVVVLSWRQRRASAPRWRVADSEQHLSWWGGLRGALALALALALPASLPMHDTVVIATLVVVAFSVLIQSLTMKPLLARLDKGAH